MCLQPWGGFPAPQPVLLPPAPLSRLRFPSQAVPGSGSGGGSAPVPVPPGEGAARGSGTAPGSIGAPGSPRAFFIPTGIKITGDIPSFFRAPRTEDPFPRSIPIPFPQLNPLAEPGEELEFRVLRGEEAQFGSKTPVSSFFLHPLRCAGSSVPHRLCAKGILVYWRDTPGIRTWGPHSVTSTSKLRNSRGVWAGRDLKSHPAPPSSRGKGPFYCTRLLPAPNEEVK